MDIPKDPQPQETKKVEEVAPKTDTEATPAVQPAKVEEPKAAVEPEVTVAEALKTPAKTEKADSVPLAVFLEEKKERKTLENKIADLEKQVAAGKKLDVGDEIAALGEEYGVDAGFLAKLTTAIESRVGKPKSAEISPDVQKILADAEAKNLNEVFKTHFDKAIAKMPEYAEIANPEVIKSLSLLPENANKTFSQIIEDAYSRSIVGKKTIETTVPNGGKEPAPIDYAKAAKDQDYLAEILANPETKAEYNKSLAKRLANTL